MGDRVKTRESSKIQVEMIFEMNRDLDDVKLRIPKLHLHSFGFNWMQGRQSLTGLFALNVNG